MALLLLIASGVLAAHGCGPGYHIRRIEDLSLEDRRVSSVQALAKYAKDGRATEALLRAVKDEDAAIRWFAVESLEMHFSCGPDEYTNAIADAWVERLGDAAVAGYTKFVPGLTVGYTARAGSVRARALLALTRCIGRDFGFDQKAWNQFLQGARAASGN